MKGRSLARNSRGHLYSGAHAEVIAQAVAENEITRQMDLFESCYGPNISPALVYTLLEIAYANELKPKAEEPVTVQ